MLKRPKQKFRLPTRFTVSTVRKKSSYMIYLVYGIRHGLSTRYNYIPVLGLFPARIREISNPRLKAWLNIRRVWNVDTNGNHEKNAIGTKMSIPMPASYRRAIDRMDFHSPSLFITGFQAAAI